LLQSIFLILLAFAAVGFAGAGVSFAIARAREHEEGEVDVGMRAVSVLLVAFGGACVFMTSGLTGILAFGGVISWTTYVFTAQKLGVFRIEDGYIRGHDSRGAHVIQRDF